ncbi:uncharacterized protein LOC111709544 [Eurytemora carolleeae]|uniref:uncharacterized protein LOC111709544 n=1 Tax=Eurytemora carolleeae TaxID=1294199 RepID=UPI000C767E7E|nr:uncharacterized protein LOC111709544 [Eurytemora carolleeae]|eukprot:XP_023339017.1 uncharacterized protein LOC111709544 [Eurytemora affinis]
MLPLLLLLLVVSAGSRPQVSSEETTVIETLVDSELTTIQTTIDETTENNEISTDTPEVSTISDVGSTIENIADEALNVQLDNRDIDDTIELKEQVLTTAPENLESNDATTEAPNSFDVSTEAPNSLDFSTEVSELGVISTQSWLSRDQIEGSTADDDLIEGSGSGTETVIEDAVKLLEELEEAVLEQEAVLEEEAAEKMINQIADMEADQIIEEPVEEAIAETIEEAISAGLDETSIQNAIETSMNDIVEEIVKEEILEKTEVFKPSPKLEPTLKIQNQPQETEVFTPGSVFGLQCEATSQVDLNIKYSWTKNGRFIDIQTDRIFLESDKKGNLIILSPDEDDVGLYQCGASNSEGVAFSRVIRVDSKFVRKLENSSPQRVGGGGRALNGPSELFLVMPTSNGKFEPEHIQIVESEIAEEK